VAELTLLPGDAGLPPEERNRPPSTRSLSPARSLGDLLADPSLLVEPEILIPFLAVTNRTTLLSGREKSGKSTLTAQLVADATRGRDVLGIPIPAPRSVLWYSIDEPLGDTVRRFQGLDADLTRLFISDAPRTREELFSCMSADLSSRPDVSLVVIDTLSRLLSGVDVNAAEKVEPVIWSLVDFFRQHNVAAVLLFHTGKKGQEYRGSTSIGATVDEILTLKRRGEEDRDDFDSVEDSDDDGRRVLVLSGRTLRDKVQLAYHSGRYGLWDALHPPRERIIEALAEGPAKTKTELVTRAKVQKKAGLQLIGELIFTGEISETGDGLSLTRLRAGNRADTPLGSRFPSVPPEGTAREPFAGTSTTTSEPSVPGIVPLGGVEREPVDIAI